MLMLVETVISDFLADPFPSVLAISGAWGSGKTHTLRNIVDNYTGATSLKKYAYVSLFGSQSLTELRAALLAKTYFFPFLKTNTKSRIQKIREKISPHIATARTAAKEFPLSKNIVTGFEAIMSRLIANTIICFDDIERMSPNIRMEDFMGLVTELKEECNCKIIIIYNEEQLGTNATAFETCREKVIDKRLAFSISPEDAMKIGLLSTTPLAAIAAPLILKFGTENIRVIKKISTALDLLFPVVKKHPVSIQKQVTIAVVVFAASLYESARGFPSTEEIIKYNFYSSRRNEDDSDSFWQDILNSVEYRATDQLDYQVLKVMQNGFIEGTALGQCADSLAADVERRELNTVFTDAWKLYHNRFDVGPDELILKFVTAVETSSRVISVESLNGTVRLTRELGYSAEADSMIETYINAHRDSPQTFSPNNWTLQSNEPVDPIFRQRMENILRAAPVLSLEDAADIIIENKHSNSEIISACCSATPQQFLELLRTHQGEHLGRLITGIRSAGSTDEERRHINQTLNEALTVIANQSSINERRVRSWGFSLPRPNEEHE
jgi:hypothetical protein